MQEVVEEPQEPKKKKRKKKVKTEEEQRLCDLLVEILVNRLERPVMQRLSHPRAFFPFACFHHGFIMISSCSSCCMRQDDVMKMPLYPTEELIWDPNLVPEEHYSGTTFKKGKEK